MIDCLVDRAHLHMKGGGATIIWWGYNMYKYYFDLVRPFKAEVKLMYFACRQYNRVLIIIDPTIFSEQIFPELHEDLHILAVLV